MVELADAAPNPEAVMIKLADTPVAVPAVSATVGLNDKTCLTEASLGHLNFIDKFHALYTFFVIHFFDYDL